MLRLSKLLDDSFRYTSNHVKYRAENPMYTLINSFTVHVFEVTAALLLLGSSSLSRKAIILHIKNGIAQPSSYVV